jgi:acetoin utilization protein AcuB
VFYVIDQGIRIQTPVDTLVRSAYVNALEKTAAVANVTADTHISDSTQTPLNKQLQQYQQEQTANQERQPAIFADQIMTQPAIAINEHENIFNATQLLKQQRFHHLPVTNKQLIVTGMITDRDIMRFSINHAAANQRATQIKHIMSPKVITAGTQTEIRSIAEVMSNQRISAMPITDQNNKLIGIISSTDILRTLVNQSPLEMWT